MTGLGEQPGRSNYFIGKDPARWRTGIPNFARVRYEGAYPGIDLVYYGNQRQLEFDFIVSPGSDPGIIRLEFEGDGEVSLGPEGRLLVGSEGSRIAKAFTR